MVTLTASACSPSRLQPPPKNTPSWPAALISVGEEPDEQRPDDAADEVNADDIERVVIAEPALQSDGEEAHDARDRADWDRASFHRRTRRTA